MYNDKYYTVKKVLKISKELPDYYSKCFFFSVKTAGISHYFSHTLTFVDNVAVNDVHKWENVHFVVNSEFERGKLSSKVFLPNILQSFPSSKYL